jgi:hypothetical protein
LAPPNPAKAQEFFRSSSREEREDAYRKPAIPLPGFAFFAASRDPSGSGIPDFDVGFA